MTDWDFSSGVAGTLRIRDTGTVVEFWVYTDYTLNWSNLQFSVTVNGATNNVSIDYYGTKLWKKVYSATVTTNQTVTFKLLTATGTTSLGGPTTCSHAISRSTIPNAPSIVSISQITNTSFYGTFTDGNNNGATIDTRQIGYGTSSTAPTTFATSDGSTVITGLVANTKYYVWARTHNSVGWSAWGPRAEFTTIDVPSAPSIVTVSNVGSVSVSCAFTDAADNGGSAVDSREIGYGTSSTAPTSTAVYSGTTTISGLTPGTLYYFWARTHNSVGWSAWGPRTSATTLKVPDAPSSVTVSNISQVSAHTKFTANGNGGSPITEYQLGYGLVNTAPQTIISSPLETDILNLSPGKTYYFWARAKNIVGWSAWGAISSAKTIAGAWVKVGTVQKEAIPYIKDAGVWKVARPWVRKSGTWVKSS